jgi:uncharacterized protein (TIGR03435 family)
MRRVLTATVMILAGVIGGFGVLFLRGQTTTATSSEAALQSEVASVKPGRRGSERIGVGIRGGEVRATNMPLRFILQWAYNIRPQFHQGTLEGGPAWIDSDGFDIVAKAATRLTIDEARAMLRALLAERFALRVHKEARQVPVFALVLAKNDGALGPGLRRSNRNCAAFSAAVENGDFNTELRRDGCGLRNTAPSVTAIRGSAAIPVLIPLISRGREIDRPILDRTGLEGTFDIELTFSPIRPGLPGRDLPTPATANPSLFTALQEQLGLKLESTKGPVDVIVIDHVEKPTPD